MRWPWFVALAGCSPAGPVFLEVPTAPATDPAVEDALDALLPQMSLEARIAQLHGVDLIPSGGLWSTAEDDEHGLASLRMTDGPRGVTATKSTVFPVAMARAATWDPGLEREVGAVMGREVRGVGGNVLLAPSLNLATDPRYGRAQESYGEDPLLVGAMGSAFIQGVQGEGVLSTAKHLAVNNVEDTRFEVDVDLDERTLREVFLPQFEQAVVEADVAAIMSSYNKLRGAYCGENEPLLSGVLKGDWGFQGLVMSDWLQGTHDAQRSIEAGLDIEMPLPKVYEDLERLVADGDVDEADIERAARRVARRKLEYALTSDRTGDASLVRHADHVALARRVATQGAVLLANDGLIPVDAKAVSEVVVVGSLGVTPNTGDIGSSNVRSDDVVTIAAGLTAVLGDTTVRVVDTDTPSPDQVTDLLDADLVVVVVGFTYRDEGENLGEEGGGDRAQLGLTAAHRDLVRAIAKPENTVVVLIGGSPVSDDDWMDRPGAILHAWYPGEQGGHAVADLLLGAATPEGRLPMAAPASAADLPPWDPVSLSLTYPRHHGQRHLAAAGLEAAFPLGFGLSTTTFEVEDVVVPDTVTVPGDGVEIAVTVRNTGARDGAEVVQVYVGPEDPTYAELAPWQLAGFAKVRVAKGATAVARIPLTPRTFAIWDVDEAAWRVDPQRWRVRIGSDAETSLVDDTTIAVVSGAP